MHNYNGTFYELSIDSTARFSPNFSLPPTLRSAPQG